MDIQKNRTRASLGPQLCDRTGAGDDLRYVEFYADGLAAPPKSAWRHLISFAATVAWDRIAGHPRQASRALPADNARRAEGSSPPRQGHPFGLRCEPIPDNVHTFLEHSLGASGGGPWRSCALILLFSAL